MTIDRIPSAEYAARRKKLSAALKKSVALIYAGELKDPLHDDFHPHPHFEYLTGIRDEPGAVLMLAPGQATPRRREMLFLRPADPELDRYDGYRALISGALRKQVGIEAVFRLYTLPRMLTLVASQSKHLSCVHPFANYPSPVSPDLAIFRKVRERIPGIVIEDHTATLARMRAQKSKNEVALLQRAVDITTQGFEEALKVLAPGRNEFDIQEALEHTYRTHGSQATGYGTIAGSGLNSTVGHYRANNAVLEDGDLICIDSGASYGGYTADITRTFPINGSFTKRQREVYELVLKAEVATIKAVKPGVTLDALDDVARKMIERAGYGDAFFHGIGHHLGLEVHDTAPDEPLREGAVITIEPGIYLPGEKLGIRIEDDILVTKTGHRNLSASIPKTVADIERGVQR